MAETFPLPLEEPHVWVCILTARCNMACSYCIQKGLVLPGVPRRPWRRYEEMAGREWVRALNDLPCRPEHPLILTGGEPTLHRDFLEIAAGLEGYRLDLTSNLSFDIPALARAMERAGKRFYSSFHTYGPDYMEPEEFVARARLLLETGLVEHPVFSFLDLEYFPQFRRKDTQERIGRMVRAAREEGIPLSINEFRANHLGAPFSRETRRTMECTSAWVNIAPDGEIYNCQYHLTAGKDSFGNIREISRVRPLPRLGTFFLCSDFGWCDPCHENSGAGMFRDPATGRVFRRDPSSSFMAYTRWLEPEELREAGRRFVLEGKPLEGAAFLSAAWEKSREPDLLNDMGVALWTGGRREDAFQCFALALEQGSPDPAVRKNLLNLARETGREAEAQAILAGIPVETAP